MKFVKQHALSILAVPLVSMLLATVFLIFPLSEYVDALQVSAEPADETSASFLFVGDVMLDRHVRRAMDAQGALHVLGGVRELLGSADLTIGNLEGPITESPSVSGGTKVGDPNNMRFTFPITSASTLASFGFDLVLIGNNHMKDFGAAGVESTKRHLSAAGIAYVGDPNGAEIKPVIREVNGVKAAFIAYNEFLGWKEEWTLQGIRDAKREGADLIVVLTHWGEEYVPAMPPRLTGLLERFRDAGAHLVVGSHPHVIGEVRDVGPMRVYYSLGNFVFDQYWDEQVSCGLALKVTATKVGKKTELTYEETRVKMERDGRTVIGCLAPPQTEGTPS